MLPLGPTGFGSSPYGALSAFAGNSLLLSPEQLVEDGLLSVSTIRDVPDFPEDRVEWDAVRNWKARLLRS